jgi:hypothetical protein
MFKKSLIAAAAIASVVTFASTAAKADPQFSFGIGFGSGFGPDFGETYHPRHRGFEGDGFVGDYPPPPPRFFRQHRRHFNDYPPVVSYGISCIQGRRVVREAGYEGVRAYKCSGPTYGYQAWRDGERFQVLVNFRGDIVAERLIY